MSRLFSFALFFSIMLSIVGGVHYYLWARLIRDPVLPALAYRTLTTLVVVLFALVPVSFFLRRSEAGWTVPITWVASVWLGLLLLLFFTLVFGDLARAVHSLASRFTDAGPADP